MYRLYNAGLGALGKMSHHYTTSKYEADDLVANHGWVYDNNANPIFYSAQDESGNTTVDNASPVYRMYNDGLAAHHFTLSNTERDTNVAKYGWNNENIGWYSYHEHNYEAVYKTVHYDAVTKQVPVYEYTEHMLCNVCQADTTQICIDTRKEHMATHGVEYDGSNYKLQNQVNGEWQDILCDVCQENLTQLENNAWDKHDSAHMLAHEGSGWHGKTGNFLVGYKTQVTSEARDEQVIDHYACSCGKVA